MPFFVNGKAYFEDIDLTQEQFYEKLTEGADISTSQPSTGEILEKDTVVDFRKAGQA